MNRSAVFRLVFASLLLLCAAASAREMLGVGFVGSGSGGGGGISVWDPTNKSAQVILTTTTTPNDTATVASTADTWAAVRGTKSYAVGTNNKVVVSIAISGGFTGQTYPGFDNNIGGNDGCYPGLCSTHSWGLQNACCDYQDQAGIVGHTCGQNTSGPATWWFAINFNNGKLWCSNDCVTWYGSGNPSTDANPAYTLTSATYFPMLAQDDAFGISNSGVINTNPSLGGCSNLSGFSGWH